MTWETMVKLCDNPVVGLPVPMVRLIRPTPQIVAAGSQLQHDPGASAQASVSRQAGWFQAGLGVRHRPPMAKGSWRHATVDPR